MYGRFLILGLDRIESLIPSTADVKKIGGFRYSRWGAPVDKAVVLDFNFGYGLRAGHRGTTWTSIRLLGGLQLSPHWFVGVATGGDYNSQTGTWCIPLALNLKGYFTGGDVRPFLSLDAGYAFDPKAVSDFMDIVSGEESGELYNPDYNTGGWLITPSFGMDIRVSRIVRFNASVGYRMQSLKKNLFDGYSEGRTVSGALDLRLGISLVWGRNE
ncbi:MAG: hypothetical protein LIO68_01040, partial [Rikenellaceae bacterium]|nr:hypothetical protein [Rikenellaceae bacterium]